MGGCGWLWVGVDGCGCVWVGVGGCGWVWGGVEEALKVLHYLELNFSQL